MTTTRTTDPTCPTCSAPETTPGAMCTVRFEGQVYFMCIGCWNADVDARQAARKAELKAARAARKAQPAPVVYDTGVGSYILGLNRMMSGE